MNFNPTNQINVTPLIYDPRYHTFDSWASLMCEAFAGNQLEIPSPTTLWQSWAVGLKGIDLFNNSQVPDPYIYDSWDQWALDLRNNFSPNPQ